MEDGQKSLEVKPSKRKIFRNICFFLPPLILFLLILLIILPEKLPNEQGVLYSVLLLIVLFVWLCIIFSWILHKFLRLLLRFLHNHIFLKTVFKVCFIIGAIPVVLLVVYIGGWILISPIASPKTVAGNGMGSGEYANQSLHIVCKICKDIKRGEVVIFKAPPTKPCAEDECEDIGRIVGLPGETITIEKEMLEVNGNKLTESYADWSEWNYKDKIEINLADNEYLALLDKRKIFLPIESFVTWHRFHKDNYIGKVL